MRNFDWPIALMWFVVLLVLFVGIPVLSEVLLK